MSQKLTREFRPHPLSTRVWTNQTDWCEQRTTRDMMGRFWYAWCCFCCSVWHHHLSHWKQYSPPDTLLPLWEWNAADSSNSQTSSCTSNCFRSTFTVIFTQSIFNLPVLIKATFCLLVWLWKTRKLNGSAWKHPAAIGHFGRRRLCVLYRTEATLNWEKAPHGYKVQVGRQLFGCVNGV